MRRSTVLGLLLATACAGKPLLETGLESPASKPPDPKELLHACRIYHKATNSRGAVEKCRSLTDIDPSVAEAHYILAFHLARLGSLDEAMESARRALKIDPLHGDAYLLLGMIHDVEGRHEDALQTYQEAVAVLPELAAAHRELGNTLLILGQVEKGITALERAYFLAPNNLAMGTDLGFAYLVGKRYTDVIRVLEAIAPRIDEPSQVHIWLGDAHQGLMELERALEAYDKAVRHQNKSSLATYRKAELLIKMDRPEEALSIYRTLFEKDRSDVGAMLGMGAALASMGRFHEAVQRLQDAARQAPDRAEIYQILAKTYSAMGAEKDAVEARKKMEEILKSRLELEPR